MIKEQIGLHKRIEIDKFEKEKNNKTNIKKQ